MSESQPRITKPLKRLQSSIEDMIGRLEHVPKLDPITRDEYGNIDQRLSAMAALARELGYCAPPIQLTIYDRDGKCRIWPTLDGKPHDKADEPFEWLCLRSAQPAYRRVLGYRLHSPQGDEPEDIFVQVDKEASESLPEPWEGIQPPQHREQMIRALRSWLLHIYSELLSDVGPISFHLSINGSSVQKSYSNCAQQPPCDASDAHLSGNEKCILVAMLELNAVDWDHRTTIDKAIRKAIGKDGNSSGRRSIGKLRRLDFVETRPGGGGGCWLTPEGIAEAKRVAAATDDN